MIKMKPSLSQEAAERAKMMLQWDVSNGVSCYSLFSFLVDLNHCFLKYCQIQLDVLPMKSKWFLPHDGMTCLHKFKYYYKSMADTKILQRSFIVSPA